MRTKEDQIIISHIANNIKRIRLEKNLMQEDVAKKAGLNANFYAKVERGKSKPSAVTITKIVRALGVKIFRYLACLVSYFLIFLELLVHFSQ
jgi:transcriptional regulator with XRE-family HTH domain